MSSTLDSLRATRSSEPRRRDKTCTCGRPSEVRLTVAIREKKNETGSGSSGASLKTKMLTLCADCALERFKAATE